MKSQTKIDYLEVWKSIFTNDNVKRECEDVLYVIELLLITPFTNTKLERVFSRMNRIKTKLHNRLGQERLDTQIRIGEEEVKIIEFNQTHISRNGMQTKFDASLEPNLDIILQSVKVLIFQFKVVIHSWMLRQ